MIGRPVGSGGEFPVSVAINAAGDSVCALNGGQVNGVRYRIIRTYDPMAVLTSM